MTRWLRDFRLIPIVLIAAGCLFALKSTGLIFDGGYTLGQRLGSGGMLVVTQVPVSPSIQLNSPAVPLGPPAPSDGSKPAWMKEMFNYPDITGSVAAKPAATSTAAKEPAAEAAKQPAGEAAKDAKDGMAGKAAVPPKTKPSDATVMPAERVRAPSGAERALLERLQERRQELDARARELDMRESLVKAAEQKIEEEAAGRKASEAKGGTPAQRKDEEDAARMKAVSTMYETMKPKDAAKIFDRLDTRVLLELTTLINPRRMSEILALMTPEVAERLTVELASRGGAEKTVNPANLPKIDGKPN